MQIERAEKAPTPIRPEPAWSLGLALVPVPVADLRQGVFGVAEDEAVGRQPGQGEDAKNLLRGIADDDACSSLSEAIVGKDDRRDAGRVDEIALPEPDQDRSSDRVAAFEGVLQLLGDGEVELPLHLDFTTTGTEVPFSELEGSQLRQLTPSEKVGFFPGWSRKPSLISR